jgi:hypothetical protein
MAIKPENSRVDVEGTAYKAMSGDWPLLDALKGGTKGMRNGKSEWLPEEIEEEPDDYANRLKRSFLYHGFKNALSFLAARPLSKGITIKGEELLPPQLKAIRENADKRGRTLAQYAYDMLYDGLCYGLTHDMVDYTEIPGGATHADVLDPEKRPWFIHWGAKAVIGYREAATVDGGTVLDQVRVKEERTEPDGEYGDTTRKYIREYRNTGYILHRQKDEGKDYDIADVKDMTLGEIPLHTTYFARVGSMQAEPPLQEVAELNLAHWQSYSDQRNVLRYARTGVRFGAGFSDKDQDKIESYGPAVTVFATDADAKYGWAEHSGKGAEAGRLDLKDLEERMQLLTMLTMVQRPGNMTATATAIHEARATSQLQMWAIAAGHTLTKMYRTAAKWLGVELPEEFAVELHTDFNVSLRGAQDIEQLIKMRMAGEIPRKYFVAELLRRGFLMESTDVDDYLALLQAERGDEGFTDEDEDTRQELAEEIEREEGKPVAA